MLEDGQKIVFLGDSITQATDGYVGMVDHMMAELKPDLRFACINAGVGGNKVTDLIERVAADVVVHDPDWVTVSVGINDVWHGANGTPYEVFEQKYDELVRALADQTAARLVLFTTTVIGEDLESEANRQLVRYNDFIRRTASKRKAMLVPMDEVFHEAIRVWQTRSTALRFTRDGVHMTPAGNYLMAFALLRAWQVL